MVNATIALFHTNGSVSTKFYPKQNAFRKLTAPAHDQLAVLYFVENPGVQLEGTQEMYRSNIYYDTLNPQSIVIMVYVDKNRHKL